MEMNRICVYGAGAVGGFVAGSLARAGREVSVVARGAHLAAIQADGLTVTSGGETFTARVAASQDPAALGPQDLVIVTLKATGLGALEAGLPPLLGPDTPVVFALNGIPWWYFQGLPETNRTRPDLGRLDPGGVLARVVAPERVVGCVIYSANTVVAPGRIENTSPGANKYALGEPDGVVRPRTEAISAAFDGTGVAAPLVADIRKELWNKLLGNVSQSILCAIVEEPLNVLGRDPALAQLVRDVTAEAVAVAAAHGVTLDVDLGKVPAPRLLNSPHKPSILQDYEAGRPMEIDAIATSVQAFGRAAGVPTPYLDTMTALVSRRAAAKGLYQPA